MLKVDDDQNFLPDKKLLQHFQEGKNAGIISEAGSPGIADPGSAAVRWAHQNKIHVTPLVGPSSIFLALMASGLNGQQFSFHGYLPVASSERKKKLKQLEDESQRKHQTQIFMETPYRNDSLLKDILEVLKPSTLLCVAANITLSDEFIFTQHISEWGKNIPDVKKKPAIFLMLAE
jgi:16S rRNA (cytidine1402-2'-O)-methyltransferase